MVSLLYILKPIEYIKERILKNSEIRKDYFLDSYVIVAPTRSKIPRKTYVKSDKIDLEGCYFCPPEIDDPKSQIQIKDYGKKN